MISWKLAYFQQAGCKRQMLHQPAANQTMHPTFFHRPFQLAAHQRLGVRSQAMASPRRDVTAFTSTVGLKGLKDLDLSKYKGVLLDQFGVLHDGRQPYPGAQQAVQHLHSSGLRVLILSNSSRRSGGTVGKLAKMGFDESWFAGVITSGEVTHQHLLQRPTPFWQQLGRRCLHITWGSRGSISLEGLGLQVESDPQQADFILMHGTEALAQPDGSVQAASLEDLTQLLQRCAGSGRRLPLVVANPDLATVDGAALVTMPGTLAKRYKEAGGEVHLMGKPAAVIYTEAAKLLGLEPQHLLAIGDSLEHDVAGAQSIGVDTLFVLGGIHAADVALDAAAGSWDGLKLAELSSSFAVAPTYAMPFMAL